MMTAFLEAFMRLDRGKRKLDVDIKNMFNEACRVAAGEDLANSEDLIGEDLSDLLPYYEMAYLQEHGNWFWLAEKAEDPDGEERADHGSGEGRWVWVPADDGFRQGSPLSCMLAALACVKCVMAAQKAMDDFHSLQRTSGGAVNGGQTVRTAESLKEERRLHELAAAASEAIATGPL